MRRGEGAEAHLISCAACRDLHAGLGELDRAMARERGFVAWLRARAGWARAAVSLAVAASVAILVVALAPRGDLSHVPLARLLGALAVLGGGAAGLAAMTLRRLDVPSRPRALEPALIALALVAPVALAFIPSTDANAAGAPLRCLIFGLVAGAPLAGVLLVLDRVGSRRALAAGAAALLGVLSLEVHCPISDTAHVLLGHAILVPLALLVARVRVR